MRSRTRFINVGKQIEVSPVQHAFSDTPDVTHTHTHTQGRPRRRHGALPPPPVSSMTMIVEVPWATTTSPCFT